MAASFVVCQRCGKVHEIAAADQLPKGWERSHGDLHCPHCAAPDVMAAADISDVLDEEVIYPSSSSPDDTLDEDHCEVCGGPCQGH